VVIRSRHAAGRTASWEFLKRRLVRIFPIFWLLCIPTALQMMHRHMPIDRTYLPGFFLLPSWTYPSWELFGDQSWTLIFEMFFYYALSAVLLLTVRRALWVSIALLGCLGLAGAMLPIQRPYLIVVANPILLEFVSGMCVALAYSRFGARRKLGVVLLLAGIVGTALAKVFAHEAATGMQMVLVSQSVLYRSLTWGVAAALLVGGTVFWSPAPKNVLWKVMVVLGNASYSAYLASSLVLGVATEVLAAALRHRHSVSDSVLVLCLVLDVMAVLVAGWLCYQFVEWPLLRKLQAWMKLRA
jgi:exopolysaccharide production protein ExoZ